ncbi:MAG: hypothetical protein Q7R91_03015 [bacterium]|nr:hypothetical protein [bacterium]
MANHEEKIGRPSIEGEGASVELGQPVFEDTLEKESVEATLDVVKEALEEFYRRRGAREDQAAFGLQVMHDPMKPFAVSVEEIKKENGDMTVPLAVLEAARGEIQYEYDTLSSYELDAENQSTNEKAEATRRVDFEEEQHYQEATDVLFSHAGYETPTQEDLFGFLEETKNYIRKIAKEEEKKYREAEDGAGMRIFRARLLTDVPAIERYENGQHTTRDYREIMDVVGSRLLSYRDRIGTMLLQYANDSQKGFIVELKLLLGETRKLELFLSQLEGERNERIAKKQP